MTPGRVVAVLGPTNTGKTHFAVERMLAHRSGMMGFPLRLLAREIYDRVAAIVGTHAVSLITGEERVGPADARYLLCTVEAMPIERAVSFLAVDEIQLCADRERGHVFTDRLLHARGADETMFLGCRHDPAAPAPPRARGRGADAAALLAPAPTPARSSSTGCRGAVWWSPSVLPRSTRWPS